MHSHLSSLINRRPARPHNISRLLLATLVSGTTMFFSPVYAQNEQRLSVEQRETCRANAEESGTNRQEQKRIFRECRREALSAKSNAQPALTVGSASSQVKAVAADTSASIDDADASLDAPLSPEIQSNVLDKSLVPSSLLPTSDVASLVPGKENGDDIIEVVAQGMGIDQPSALNNAYSNAVQQALGLYVDAETMVENDEIVRDQILTYSKGFIQTVDIVSQSQSNGLFQVNIRAQVKRQKLLEKARANNITLKKVEGDSLHAQVVTQVKQEQNAKSLLNNAFLPFTDAVLYRADIVGEPKIIKKGQDNVVLSYPVGIYVDENSYNESATNLVNVLNKVSYKKDEKLVEYREEGGKIKERVESMTTRDFISKIYFNSKRDIVAIMTWKDKSFTKSKWSFFYFPEDISLEEFKIPFEKQKFLIELSLLDDKNNILALGNSSVAVISYYGRALYAPFRKMNECRFSAKNHCIVIKSYFDDDGYANIKPVIDIQVTVSTNDLPAIKQAKLEVDIE